MADTEKRITAKMVLDSTGYNSSIKGINSEMKNYQAQMKVASEGIKSFGKDSEKLKSVQESLAKQVELHSKKVDMYKQSMEKATAKMTDNIKERDKLKSSLDSANKKYDEAIKMYGKESTEAKKAKEEVDRLKQEHEKASKSVETNAKSIQKYETDLHKANAEMVKTQGELKKVSTELATQDSKWLGASENLKKSSEKMKNAGSSISKAGDGILKFTAPLAAGGIASLKFSTDFEDSIAKVSTISEDAQVPIGDLRKGILKLSDDTGIASTKIADNVYDAISAGQSTGDAVNFVTNSTKLAKSGFAEAGQSLDLLTTILNSYGMKSTEVSKVSDVLIQVQNRGKVTVGELSSTMGKIIPTANAMGVNLEQVSAGFALMTIKGIKSAETTSYMNAMFNEMGKSGSTAFVAIKEATGKTFPELIKSGKSVGDVLNTMDNYAKKNGKSLKDMFGSSEAGTAALVLATDGGKAFNTELEQMGKSAGATDEAFKKVTNTTGERLKKSLNQLKNNSIKFGDSIAPMMDKVSSVIGKIADKLNGLSKEQLDSIAKWGMFAIATGGALKIVGSGISTIGNIAGGLSKLTGFLGKAKLATSGIGAAAGTASTGIGGLGLAAKAGALLLNPYVLAVAGVGIAGYATYKYLKKDAIPAVDLFGKKTEYSTKQVADSYGNMTTQIQKNTIKISKSTRDNVGAYMKMDTDVKKSLNDLYLNSTQITEKNKNEIVAKYTEMGTKINTGLKTKQAEEIANLTSFFGKSTAISDKEESEVVAKTNKYYADKKGVVEIYQKQINDILEKAKNEHRAITAEEATTIGDIQNRMKEDAVKNLSANELEAKVIMERMKGYDGRITAEQASEHLKQLNRSRDGAVKSANDEYSKRLATIIKMRDEAHTISADQADKLIADAKRQKDGTISKAEETRLEALEKMRSMNKDMDKQVDTSTGKLLTKWDKLKRWWNGWSPETKQFNYNVGGGAGGVAHAQKNYTGNTSFSGGLTTLHEHGYEVYDLPRSSRIYNHEASEDLVLKTAESVATKVANSMLKNFSGGNSNQTIIVPVQLDGREIARVTTPYVSNNLAMATRGRR